MLPTRSLIQRSKTLNPEDKKIFSTYQDEYNSGKAHGNLVAHYGNSAYLRTGSSVQGQAQADFKPFITPSYHNLTNDSYINNKISDNYSNNYRTSEDNILKRPIHSAPIRTKLDHLFKVKTAPVSKPDQSSIYENNYFNKYVNDHFVSKKLLKTETNNLRDTVACLMELADYLRNKSYDINQRKEFLTDQIGLNQLDLCGQLFSKLISAMESLLLSYNKLNSNSVELKRNNDNMLYAQNIIDRNLWVRKVRPTYEREYYNNIEQSINKDNLVLNEQKSLANQVLKEAHSMLNKMESYTHNNLEEVMEEAKVIIMHKLHRKEYESAYLRDENGYIKRDAKLPMKIENWFELANRVIKSIDDLVEKSSVLDRKVIDTINNIGEKNTKQWLNTHQIASQQVEDGLKAQSKLLSTQYDLNREFDHLNNTIEDTKIKHNKLKVLNELNLNQLEVKLSEIDPYHFERRERLHKYTNNIWSSSNELRDNLDKMIEYKKTLNDRRVRLDKNIHSNHVGVNFDLKTIVDPRRFHIATNPSLGLVYRSCNTFN